MSPLIAGAAEAAPHPAAVDEARKRHRLRLSAGIDGVGLALLQRRRAHHHAAILPDGCKAHERLPRSVRHRDGARSEAAERHQHAALCGVLAEILRHAGGSRRHDDAAGDRARSVKVQRAVAVVGRAADIGLAARNGQRTVGVDAVAARIYRDFAARDADIIGAVIAAAAAEIVHARAEAALVVAARRVKAVVGGGDVDDAAGDVHRRALDTLIALCHGDRAAGHGDIFIGMHAVVPRRQHKGAVGDHRTAVAVDGVVAAIERVDAALEQHACARLQSLCRGVGRDRGGAAAARFDGNRAAVGKQHRFRLHAVLARRERQRHIGQRDKAALFIAVVGGAQRISAAIDRDGSTLDDQRVLAVYAVIFRRHPHRGGLHAQGVLAGDAVVCAAVHRERPRSGDDHVRLGIDAGVRLFVLLGGQCIREAVVRGVGERVLRSLRQPQGHAFCLIDI